MPSDITERIHRKSFFLFSLGRWRGPVDLFFFFGPCIASLSSSSSSGLVSALGTPTRFTPRGRGLSLLLLLLAIPTPREAGRGYSPWPRTCPCLSHPHEDRKHVMCGPHCSHKASRLQFNTRAGDPFMWTRYQVFPSPVVGETYRPDSPAFNARSFFLSLVRALGRALLSFQPSPCWADLSNSSPHSSQLATPRTHNTKPTTQL